MSEDYTWGGATAPSAQARVRELEAQLNAAVLGQRELERENAALRAKLDAVPVDAIELVLWGDSTSFGYVEAVGMVGNWLVSVSELTPTAVQP